MIKSYLSKARRQLLHLKSENRLPLVTGGAAYVWYQ